MKISEISSKLDLFSSDNVHLILRDHNCVRIVATMLDPLSTGIDIDVSGRRGSDFSTIAASAGMHLPLRARDGRGGSKVKQKMSYGGMPRRKRRRMRRRRSEEIVGTGEKEPEASRARATGGS